MIFKSIIFEKKNNISKVTLNRPEQGNTLNLDLAKELFQAVNEVAADDNMKALILTGSGKLFCGGGDLKYLLSNEKKVKQVLLEMTHYFHGAISRMVSMNIPSIVALNGTAGGGGFSLAITGDIIYSIKQAKFTLAYTNAGLSPDGSSTYFLPRLIGLKAAKELMLTNRVFTAQEAFEMGIIDKVVEDNEELIEETQKQAVAFSKGPTNAYGSVKKLLNQTFSNGLETQMEREGIYIAENAQSDNGQEGMLAFKEKRKPFFK